MIQEFEKLLTDLKETFAKYSEKKSINGRCAVRKVLQSVKLKAQEMRVWMLKDFTGKEKE